MPGQDGLPGWFAVLVRGAHLGERLTDNTLIRVAVDLLLARAGEVHGATEAALSAKSVGL